MGNCFTVTEKGITDGIELSRGQYLHINVGQGEKSRRFPVSKSFAALLGDTTRVIEASVKATVNSGTLLLVQPDSDERRAIVHLRITGGDQGTLITSGTYMTLPCPFQGQQATDLICNCGVEAVGGKHPAAGEIKRWRVFPPDGVMVAAEGFCQQGTGYPLKGHKELLVTMQPGTCIRVLRKGRLRSQQSVRERIIEWTGTQLQFGTAIEKQPEIDPFAFDN